MKNIYVLFTGLIWLFAGLLHAGAGTPGHSPYPERATGAAAPTFTYTKTDVTTCNGATTGSITVTASGGTGNYTYSKDNGATFQAGNQFTNLAAGTYQVLVKDGSNVQSAAQAVTISQPDALTGRATSVTSTCPGLSTGAISFTAGGGTAPYQYAINNGTYQSSNVFTGLAAGNYLLSVKDANGCVISPAYYQVTAPTAPTVTPVVTDISCNGRQDGAIRVDLTGGVNQGATTISIDNGATYINNTVFSALSAGTYKIIVKYANNCLTPVKEATVNQPTALSFTTQITGTISCNGGQTGAIQVTASGGTAPYQYSKDNGASYQASNQFNELSANTYRITVTDSRNCPTAVQRVTISQPTELAYTLSKTDVTCFGARNGTVTVDAQGGTSPYQYVINMEGQEPTDGGNPRPGTSGRQFTNLATGSYYVTITDANGCSVRPSLDILQPEALVFETSTSAVLCNGGSSGRITVTASGGTGPYQYSKDNGTTYQSASQFGNVAAGVYSIVVKDANNCVSPAQSVTVTQPAALAFTTSKTDAVCAGGNTGSIGVTASGGAGPYQYSKDNGTTFQTSSSFTGLTAGTYQVLVRDANNCVSAAQSVSIGQPAALTFTTTKTDVAGCNGDNTGSITATVNGGTGAYQYSKDNGATFQTSNSFSGLSAGSYPIVVKDASGCVSAAQSIVINQPPTLAFSTNATNVSCFSGTNGSITFTASGGTGAYQYSITNGRSFQASNSFTGLAAGAYPVLTKDANGCLAEGPTVIISQPSALVLTIEQANVNCNGAATGTIVAGASGGTPAYQYSKDNGATYQGGNQFSNLTAGVYSIRIKDANNCLSGTQTVTITQPTALSLSAAQTNVTTCFGGNNGSITLTATGGTGAYQYSKDNGASFQSTNTFTGLAAGSYQVLVKDANNCVSTAQTLVITQPTAVSFTTTKTDVTSCNGATTGSIVIAASGGTGPYQYSKDNGASFQTSNSFTGLGANSYQVVVKDANGCLAPVQTVVINQPSPIEGSVVSTTQTCPGLSTGGLTASASGGTAPYQYALNNGTYQSGNVFTGLAVGDYTLSVKDANGCIYNKTTYQITAPTAPTVTPNVTNLTCNGVPNGAIYVGTSGGVNVGQLYASINNGATYTTNIQFNNLAAGTYQVLVKYANNCLTPVQSVTVTQPASVSFNTSVTSAIKCYGDITGAIAVTASGGTAPYQYSKDNGASYQDGNLFGELAAGTYPIVVKDANGCITPARQVVLSQPTELAYTVSKTDVSCFGAGNGTITVEGQGGTGPYEYAINREGLGPMTVGNPGAGTSGSSRNARAAAGKQFTNLAAGTYYVSITDANGCNVRLSLDISQPEALALETSTSSVRCNGGSTGRITVTASGGTPAYQYSKDNGTTYQSASQFDNVAAGVYTVVVKDANNCVSPAQSVTVVQPAVLTASTSKSNVTTCFGGNSGSISVTASGGTAPYQYSKDNGGTFQPGNSFASLTAGTYAMVVKDANGCVTAAQNVTIDQPAAVSFTTTKVNVSGCYGDNTGSITVTASGGTGAYQYSKDNGATFQVANQFAALPAGSYQVVVKDANGCASAAQTVVITQPALLTYTTAVTNVSCYGGTNGSIMVTASGGTAPYQYSKDNGATYQASNSFTGLGATSYQVVVKDASGCRLEALAISITQPDVLSLSAESINLSCNGAATGSITVTGSGGVPAYQYSKDNGATYQASNQFTGLTAGTYSVRIKDANGCVSGVRSVILTQPAALSLGVAKTNVTSCNGDATGSLSLTASGGTGAYQYSKDNGASFQTSNQFGSLTAGVYAVLAKDANGCLSPAQSVTISQPSALSLSVTATDTRCFGDNTGTLTITASGGTGPYSYTHDRTEGFRTSNRFENLSPGGYNVRVRDANGCVSAVQSVTINQPDVLTMRASSLPVTCFGNSTGSISVTANGGVPAYQYSKDNGASFQSASQFTGLGVGTYSVIVKDANNCVTTAQSITVTQPAALAVTISKTDIVSCLDGNTGTISLSATGGTTPYQYSKDNGATYQADNSFAKLSAGVYQIVVKDANSCVTAAQSVTIAQPQAITLRLAKTNVTSCNGDATGSLSLTASGGTGAYQYSKDNGASFQTSNQFGSLTAGVYAVLAKDANGCLSPAQSVTISQPSALSLSVVATDTRCFGENTGTLTITASGGTGPYSYTHDRTEGFRTSNRFENLSAGEYKVRVQDANGCVSVVQSVTINQPQPLTFTTSQINVSCAGTTTGSISFSATGGTGAYQYSIDNGNRFQAGAQFTNLPAGSYPVLVKDANGCLSEAPAVVLTQPAILAVTASKTNIVSCSDGNTGTISLSATGGTTPYRYSKDNGATYQESPQFAGLSAGPYRLVVNDANGCQMPVSVTIVSPCCLSATANPATIAYGQSTTLTATGCSGTISWTGGPQNSNVYVVSPTKTTSYTATCSIPTSGSPVTCTSVVTVTVNQPVCTLTTSASPTTITNGQSTTLTASGCTGTVSWNGGPQNSNVYVVNPAQTTTYTATCTIATSGSPVTCQSTVTVTVNQPVCALTTSASPTTITNGQRSTLTASGCIGTVNWTGGPTNSTVYVVNPTQTTSYTATCTIATSGSPVTCTSVVTVAVTQQIVCALTTTANPATITNGQSATLTASGCTGTVNWRNGPSNAAVYVVAPTQTTSYTATCSMPTSGDPVTCTSVVTVVVNQPVCAIAAQASSNAIFNGQSVTLTATGCANGTISWSGSSQTGSTLIVNPATTTTYVATCTIPTSGSPVICTAPVSVTVVNRPECTLQVQGNPSTVFAGDPVTLTATGCNGTLKWSTGQSESIITVTPTQTTTYDVTCTTSTPAGSVSCPATTTVTVIAKPVCNLSLQASPTAIFNGQSATLTASGCEGGTISWNSQAGGGSRIIVSPTATTTYSATCTFTTLAGSVSCTAPVTVTVTQPMLQITGSGDVLPLNAVTWAGTVTQNVGPFVWQYKTPTGDWQNFPTTFDNNPSILVSATSFLGSAAPTLINQAIQLRAFSPYLISNVLTVTIRQQNPTIASLVTTKALCANTATGSFTLTVGRNLEPGESAFRAQVFALTNGAETVAATYTFTGPTFVSPAVFAKGAYRVRLQSSIGSGSSAESTQDFTIEDAPVLTLTATKTDILCFGGTNGTINLVASGGAGPYQYAVNGGSFQPFQAATQQQIANLAAGVYSVQLRDNNACSSAQPVSVTIAQPTASLTITRGTVKNPTGFQVNDGTITLQVTGGTPDYSFAWSVPNPAASTQPTTQGVTHTITSLGDGNYTVVVTDKAGCTTQASYSLTQPNSILAKTTIVKAISCAGGANGIIQVDASGGVPRLSGDAYSYDWKIKGSTTSISQTNRLTNATSTTYTVTVTDGNGVAKAFDVYLPEPLPVAVSVTSLTNVACFGTATGGVSLSVQGGVAPYSTRWNTQQTGLALTNMQAGRYVAVVTDANACQAQASVQIQQPQALSATLASVNPSCYDICNGQLAATLTGGTAPYVVTWQNTASQALSLTGLCSGSYTVNIKDANGCAVTQTTSLTRPVQKQIVLRTNTFICRGQTVDLDATIADGVSYAWTYPDGTTRTTPVVSVTSAGKYQVTATDKNGCTVTAQTSLSASETQAPTLAFAVASQIGVGEPLIAVNITNPRPTQTSWTIPASASLVSSSDDRLELVFKNTGTYPITMNGVQGQCEFKTTKMVTAVPASTVVTTAQTTPFIQELTILPNPNSGTFKVRIRLADVSDVKIRVKPLLSTGTDIYQQSAAGQQDYELSVSIPVQNLQTGNYLLTLETAKAIQTVKLLIVL